MLNLLNPDVASPAERPYVEAAAKAPAQAPAVAIERYRSAIRSGEDGKAEAEAAWIPEFIREKDAATYAQRVRAAKDATGTAASLEEKAAAMQAEYDAAKAIVWQPLEQFGTVRELADALTATVCRVMALPADATTGIAKIDNLPQLGRAIEMLGTQLIPSLFNRVSAARQTADGCEEHALDVLRRTLAPAVQGSTDSIRNSIRTVQTRIAGRQGILNIDARIAEAEVKAAELATTDKVEAYRAARVTIDRLRRLAEQRPQAMADNAEDEKAVIDLQERFDAATRELLNPSAMRFSDE